MRQRIEELVLEAGRKARAETSDEPEPQYTGEVDFPIDCKVGRGLEGAVACATKVGYVNGARGWLVYRGLNIFDLAAYSSYEETAYLLLFGALPSKSQLKDFKQELISKRAVPAPVMDMIRTVAPKTHPMSALRSAVSLLGNLDPTADDTSVEAETKVAIQLIAMFPTLAGAVARLRWNKEPLPLNPELSHAAYLVHQMTGEVPDELKERVMDVSLILHADHGMNASTFTTMVVNSSLSDMYGSVVAGVASLKGPLHGGANERVLYDLEEIGEPANVENWYAKAETTKRKVMGFGHRVYKAYDPRARILGPLAGLLVEHHPHEEKLYKVATKLEQVVCGKLSDKKIFPNVDFYAGLVYRSIGIETAMMTPIFAVSRVAGWTARALEYLGDNRIFRPRAIYTGPIQTGYVPMDKR
ncbi:MAG: citrate synthase/methylcitrate synthase [Candidatus Eisenbacteria bacterium]